MEKEKEVEKGKWISWGVGFVFIVCLMYKGFRETEVVKSFFKMLQGILVGFLKIFVELIS